MWKKRLVLGEQTVCAARIVKEAVHLYVYVTGVPIMKYLIACSRKAHAEYVQQLGKDKNEEKKKREEQRKQELMSQEIKVLSANKD